MRLWHFTKKIELKKIILLIIKMDNNIPSTIGSSGRKTTALEQTMLQMQSEEQKLQALINKDQEIQNSMDGLVLLTELSGKWLI